MDVGTHPPSLHPSTNETASWALFFSQVEYPRYMSASSVSFVSALLRHEVADRLGSGPTGKEDIKSHTFMAGMYETMGGGASTLTKMMRVLILHVYSLTWRSSRSTLEWEEQREDKDSL